ncbi:MAG: hypothetical protein M1820_010323 [Bogoriella megaspora]|nr:MAG: hypothetical protein M1820_010323 [Bogoriella megaspora]
MTEPDELCKDCSAIDLFSLFTAPRYFPNDDRGNAIQIPIGTLEGINTNQKCPSCRLLKHIAYSDVKSHPWEYRGNEPELSKVRCNLRPVRANYHEEIKYLNKETRDMVATSIGIFFSGTVDCTQEESEYIKRHYRSPGFRLLSPDSVDPKRPLLNGYRATNIESSLNLLSKWLRTCQNKHRNNCYAQLALRRTITIVPQQIRVIDVSTRVIVEKNLDSAEFAALSYFWGRGREEYMSSRGYLNVRRDINGRISIGLPNPAPKLVEDALYVCKRLSIPFLWVDLYCIHEEDALRKSLEISSMGQIYSFSTITLVAAGLKQSDNDQSLLQESLLPLEGLDTRQRSETIQGKQYVSATYPVQYQIFGSEWNNRGWTMQEGQFATRVAFFGRYDISFMCRSGHWRESLHSGVYGHDADIPSIDIRSTGFNILSARKWLDDNTWSFEDYDSILMAYTPRKLSYESDRLNAISGCLTLIGDRKDMRFIDGLPSRDIHYALLWTGEYDRPREGFPSWSWAGWHCMQQGHLVCPVKGSSGALGTGNYGHDRAEAATPDVELQGYLISPREHPRRFNKCRQDIAVVGMDTSVLNIAADESDVERPVLGENESKISASFDSRAAPQQTWDQDVEYKTPYDRLLSQDLSKNIYRFHYPYWRNYPPYFKIGLPYTLRGSTLTWLLRDGIELIKILEVEFIEGEGDQERFHHVLCMGIDKSRGLANQAHRMGVFCIPKEWWIKAEPKGKTFRVF